MLLSVIVPAYNCEKYLQKCIASIVACPVQEMECILVNDGSTDATLEICKAAVEADPRFILMDKPNTGVSDSRNSAIQKARGDYLFFVDADDQVQQACWADIAEQARQGVYDLVAYAYTTEFENGTQQEERFLFAGETSHETEHLHKALLTSPMLNVCWGNLLRRQIVAENAIAFEKGKKTGEDTVFMLQFIECAHHCLLSNKSAIIYRVHSQSAMRSNSVQHKLNDFKSIYTRRNAFASRISNAALHSEMYRQYFSVITNLLLEYAAQKPVKEVKKVCRELKNNDMAADIINGTKRENLTPVYKKWEHTWLQKGRYGVLAMYFKAKSLLRR